MPSMTARVSCTTSGLPFLFAIEFMGSPLSPMQGRPPAHDVPGIGGSCTPPLARNGMASFRPRVEDQLLVAPVRAKLVDEQAQLRHAELRQHAFQLRQPTPQVGVLLEHGPRLPRPRGEEV